MEIFDLTRAEVFYRGRFPNKYLAEKFGRSERSVKNKRWQGDYRSILAGLKAEFDEAGGFAVAPPPSASHSPTVLGCGSGNLNFRTRIPAIISGRLASLAGSQNHQVRAILETPNFRRIAGKLTSWTSAGGTNAAASRHFWTSYLETSTAGGGLVQGAHDATSGDWLRQAPKHWSGTDYVSRFLWRY